MVRKIFLVSALLVPLLVGLAALRWPLALWLLGVVLLLIAVGTHDPSASAGMRCFASIPSLATDATSSRLSGPRSSNTSSSPAPARSPAAVSSARWSTSPPRGIPTRGPFGTQRDVNRIGYEWMHHSLAPKPLQHAEPRLQVGGRDCSQPYLASHLNISAMSFGSLSGNAILALSRGARMAGCLQNGRCRWGWGWT